MPFLEEFLYQQLYAEFIKMTFCVIAQVHITSAPNIMYYLALMVAQTKRCMKVKL